MNRRTKRACHLIPGDRVAFLSGQASNFTGHRCNVPMEDTIVRITPYEATRCIVVQLASGLKLSYYWTQAVFMAVDDRVESKPLAVVTVGLTYKGVSLE
jgi:hypothetical protein